MKTAIYCVSCVISLALTTVPATAATKVFLLAGQSNMNGIGHGRELIGTPLEKYHDPQPGVKIWNNGSRQWAELSSYSDGDCFGPEVSFGYEMHAAFPNDDIYLVKWAYGGTNLYADWKPANGGGWCYNSFKMTAMAALQNLDAAHLSPSVAGMLWMQGEGDAANSTSANAYQQNLIDFIAAVRTDPQFSFNSPDMPFVLGRIIQGYGTSGDNATVRTAQMTVPTLVEHTMCINTDDLQVSPEIPLHFGTQGQIELGIRFADKFKPTPEPSMSMLLLTGSLAAAVCMWKTYLR